MQTGSAMAKSSEPNSRPDYNDPSFRGALTCDQWSEDNAPEFSTIPTSYIVEIGRASNAIRTIARLVHNSLTQPAMSNAEPLGNSTHQGLLDALEILGVYLSDIQESMTERACDYARFERVSHEREVSHV